mgnify:CR=1 FL=1
MTSSTSQGGTPTTEFVALVKDALENLYDPSRLDSHDLCHVLLSGDRASSGRSLAIRQVLLDAIDRLKPHHKLSIGARQRRLHQILELRYVEALPFREVMSQLALSQAQYHREQRHALEALAALLWEDVVQKTQSGSTRAGDEPLHGQLAELQAATHSTDGMIDLNDVARSLLDILREATSDHGVVLEESIEDSPCIVSGSRTGIRQLIITLVGYVLGGAHSGRLEIHTDQTGREALLCVAHEGDSTGPELPGPENRLDVARQLLVPLGGSLSTDLAPHRTAVTVRLPLCSKTLLVIDDNPDMVHLVRRLVAPKRYTVLGADSVQEGLHVARSARPEAILLDLMLPEQDGWDALQALRHDPATRGIPVLVCSVLDERQLALALGAVEFVRKPLTRPALLEALAPWLDASPPEGANQGPSGPIAATC